MLSIIANTRTGIKNNAATFINSFASMERFLETPELALKTMLPHL
jgi:hypothetical protein